MKRNLLRRHLRAFSLVEITVVVAIIGVLAAVAIPTISNVTEAAERSEATDHVESLNKALKTFNQSNWDIRTTADNSATTDEFLVLRSLQYKWPAAQMKVGAPYFTPNYNPVASSDSARWRARWNGVTFELLAPGTSGSGLLISHENNGVTSTPYSFPSGYKPEGAL